MTPYTSEGFTASRPGPLAGLRVLEIAGIGPGPFSGMLLADLGADVVVIDRPPADTDGADVAATGVLGRGKRRVVLDLKSTQGIAAALELVEHSDALIEGMRPGVMERLGLGPEICLARNPRLVYGRMTGWGQDGPLASAAGHDLNYIALSGALWYAGEPGGAPLAPPTLVGDIGGGALYLVIGLLAGMMSARQTGRGQVVDAAIVDGSAHMMNLLLGLMPGGHFVIERGASLLDGPHWYSTYRCADGNFISVGALEPKFYRLLLEKLGLAADARFADGFSRAAWPRLRQCFSELFAQRTRDEWCVLLQGTDACFAPVLSPPEAAAHPHMAARGVYSNEGGILQANPAPRFSATPARPLTSAPREDVNVASVLDGWRRT